LEVEYYLHYNKEFDGIPVDVWGTMNPFDTVFWRKGK